MAEQPPLQEVIVMVLVVRYVLVNTELPEIPVEVTGQTIVVVKTVWLWVVVVFMLYAAGVYADATPNRAAAAREKVPYMLRSVC